MTIFMVFDRGNFYCLFLPWHFTFWLPWQIYLKHHGNCVAHTTSFSLNLPWHLKIYTTTILFMRYNTWHHKLFWDDHVAIMDFFWHGNFLFVFYHGSFIVYLTMAFYFMTTWQIYPKTHGIFVLYIPWHFLKYTMPILFLHLKCMAWFFFLRWSHGN